MKSEIASIRQEYLMASLSESDVDQNPVIQFQQWFQEAVNASIEDVNAMTLSTVDEHHLPKSRIVLLKGVQDNQFVFYTNYHSEKGRNMETNPHVAISIFWKELQRQVRIEGQVTKLSEKDAVEYFRSRPLESQLGAWASKQSEVLENREKLETRFQDMKNRYSDGIVPKPPHWGGYLVNPVYLEFWQGRANRMHDRICYRKTDTEKWIIERLNP